MSECTELTPTEQLQRAFAKLLEAARDMGEAMALVINSAFSCLTDAFASVKFDTWLLAVIWAEDAHPEWTAIYYRTKKARIRKKYRDRIMREYVKEVTN